MLILPAEADEALVTYGGLTESTKVISSYRR